MSGFSLGDIISGGKKGEVGELFSKKAGKAAPGYDYSVVPDRVPDIKIPEEVDEMDERTKQRKQKKQDKKKRKALEMEMAKNQAKKRKFSGGLEIEPVQEPEQQVEPKPYKVQKEDDSETFIDPEKEKRTIFVGNIPIGVKKGKALKKVFGDCGTIESIRYRSAARPDLKTTKKVAVIKNMYHEERTNINAYIRFSTEEEATQSCDLNGTNVQGHIIRVDMSLNSKSHEQNKAIFLGNLNFKTHEDDVRKAFERCGEIVDVRLVRDSSTGIGKGFGYINFVVKDSVETALKLDGTEVCGRKVRVTRSLRKPKGNKVQNKGLGSHGKNVHSNNVNSKNSNKEPIADFKSKFEDRKKKFHSKNENKVWKKKGPKAAEKKAFQGVSTTDKKPGRSSLSKEDLKKKYIARKLMG